MTVIHIGFLDWTSGRIVNDEYHRVETRGEVDSEFAETAAQELIWDGAGYWDALEDSPTAEQLADPLFSPPMERYFVHAEKCPEAEDSRSWSVNCDCGLDKFNGEIAV